ncbi:hypothetical protein LP420_38405 [Massilia sp. B-10]|nr:hypothetical protein LP420_38405 [Massilia sp. B-10]
MPIWKFRAAAQRHCQRRIEVGNGADALERILHPQRLSTGRSDSCPSAVLNMASAAPTSAVGQDQAVAQAGLFDLDAQHVGLGRRADAVARGGKLRQLCGKGELAPENFGHLAPFAEHEEGLGHFGFDLEGGFAALAQIPVDVGFGRGAGGREYATKESFART